jgi:hypothetical protein
MRVNGSSLPVHIAAYSYTLEDVQVFKEAAKNAYVKALKSSKSYEVETLKLARYDLKELREEFIYWCEVEAAIEGISMGMRYRNVIPLDW